MATHVRIYTDGACLGNPGPGGYAALIIYDTGRTVTLKGGETYTTNNRMELTALVVALEYIRNDSNYLEYEIDVYTDSNYLKQSLTTWIHKWKRNGWRTYTGKPVENKDLWLKLLKLTDGLKIRIHWIKAHSGIKENEIVDKVARSEAKRVQKEQWM